MKLTLKKAKELMDGNGGSLYLRGTGITALPDNLIVGGWLDLEGCTGITALPDNLTVGGWLDLRGTGITALPDNLTVGGWLDLRGTGITALPDNLTVGGSLDLRGTGITALPDNLIVGGWLDLEGCTGITALPDNLTVGGWLDLEGCTGITALPDNLTVGGSLYLRGTGITAAERKKVKKFKNGEYVPKRYLYADGILTHIKAKREIKGYVFYKGKIANKNVVSDGKNFAHCATFREGVQDLAFKAAKDRGAEQYRHLTLDSVLTAEEIITMYRVVTGACRQGTQNFIDSLGELKDTYTLREAIEITNGQYGSGTFKAFFEKE